MAVTSLVNMELPTSSLALNQSISIENLEAIQDNVNAIMGLNGRLVGRYSKSPFIHVSHTEWENFSSFDHGPTFYLIIKPVQEDMRENLQVQVVAFNGKLLGAPFKETFPVHDPGDVWRLVQNSRVFAEFSRGNVQLCKGLSKSARKNSPGDVLRESLSDRVITRSRYCHYAVIKNDSPNCSACRSFSNQGPPGLIKNPESADFIKSESEEPDDFDDYETAEFLDNDDVRVVSITNGLPQKLTKLNGITISKSGPSGDSPVPEEESTSGFPEPQVKLTVMAKDGRKAKELSFNDFRKDINIEKERERIRQPAMANKKKKPKSSPEEAPPEKRTRRTRIKSEDEDKPLKPQIKHCPVCNKPFTDISEFMKHLGSCDPEIDEGGSDSDFGPDLPGFESDEDYKPPVMPADPDPEPLLPDSKEELLLPEKKPRKLKTKKPLTPRKKPSPPAECTVCMTHFKQGTNFPQHMKAHEDKIDVNAPIECPVCSIEVESRKVLNPHIKEHHPDKGGCCVECLEFMPFNQLKNHMSRKHHHAPEREGQLCPICGKKCYYTADLEIHIAVQHMGLALERPPKEEGEVMCHECGKVFSHRYRLKQHLSTTHNKSRDHPCPFCAKVFCLKHQLTKHLLTHADVKPFKCKYCDYQNVRKYRVTKHCQKQHRVKGTDDDIETMQGADKPSEFVHNVFGL